MAFNFTGELKELGLMKYESEADDREPIDFSIADDNDNVAWVWGSEPWTDVQVECTHPYELIEWGDDNERGVCPLCGATCDWSWVEDLGSVGDYHWEGREREPYRWYVGKIGGLIGEYLEGLKRKW